MLSMHWPNIHVSYLHTCVKYFSGLIFLQKSWLGNHWMLNPLWDLDLKHVSLCIALNSLDKSQSQIMLTSHIATANVKVWFFFWDCSFDVTCLKMNDSSSLRMCIYQLQQQQQKLKQVTRYSRRRPWYIWEENAPSLE